MRIRNGDGGRENALFKEQKDQSPSKMGLCGSVRAWRRRGWGDVAQTSRIFVLTFSND